MLYKSSILELFFEFIAIDLIFEVNTEGYQEIIVAIYFTLVNLYIQEDDANRLTNERIFSQNLLGSLFNCEIAKMMGTWCCLKEA